MNIKKFWFIDKKNYIFLKILFIGIFIFGTIGIIYIGWKAQEGIKTWNADNSLNTLVCNSGKSYSYTKYSSIKDTKNINFLQDAEFRNLCVYGSYLNTSDKQSLIEYIFTYDNQYFNQKNVSTWQDVQGHFYLVNPSTTIDPRTVKQLSDEDLLKTLKEPNKKLYSGISYTLKNTPPVIKTNYMPTLETLLLFWFIFYLLRKFTYYAVGKVGISERLIKINKQYPLILPTLIVALVIIVIVHMTTNNSHPQELLSLNQKCHDLATKYVNDQETKYETNSITHETDYSAQYLFETHLNNYAYNQQLNTCLVYYDIGKSVNPNASLTPSPLPSIVEYTDYVDDVISGKNLAQINLDTDCDQNTDYCQNLVNFTLKLRSWNLSDLNYQETFFLQTIGRFSFIRSWLGI